MLILLRLQSNLKNITKLSTNLREFYVKNVNIIKRFQTSSTEAQKQHEQQNLANLLSKKLAENKLNNILVYSCKAGGSIVLNSVGVFVCFLLLGASYNTFMLFDSLKLKARKVDDEDSFMGKAIRLISSERFKYSLCSVMTILGIVCMFATFFFSMRSVNKMYLLKGSRSLGVVTDGIFGKQMTYKLALDQTSFSSTRLKRTSMISFKNKNHYFYFLLNNIDGEYHEKTLFDHVICKS